MRGRILFIKLLLPGHFCERSWLCLEETLAGSRGVMAGSRSGPGAGLVELWSGCSREVLVGALGVSGCSLSPLKIKCIYVLCFPTCALQSIMLFTVNIAFCN